MIVMMESGGQECGHSNAQLPHEDVRKLLENPPPNHHMSRLSGGSPNSLLTNRPRSASICSRTRGSICEGGSSTSDAVSEIIAADKPRRRFPGDTLSSPPLTSADPQPSPLSCLLHRSPAPHAHVRSRSHGGQFSFPASVEEIGQVASRVAEQAEELVMHIWKEGWRLVQHHSLPHWLKDNDFLIAGHRPQLNSFRACFKSIFAMHTETINIWTHLIGCMAFLVLAICFLTRTDLELQWQEKAVFVTYFAGTIICLSFSWLYHTVYCHSERVGKLFNKLDYAGISLLTICSFVPWLYYSFYCQFSVKLFYLAFSIVLGLVCIAVSTLDKFSAPKFRTLRAIVFAGLGLSGVIPCGHYVLMAGFWEAVSFAALGWLILMAILYITGAVIYAVRLPERFFPGKCDIWFQSHQIFHVFVVAAAFVHLHGITEIAQTRLALGECLAGSTLG